MAWTSKGKFTESRSIKKWIEKNFYRGNRVFDRRLGVVTSNTSGDDPTGEMLTVPPGTLAVNLEDNKVWIFDDNDGDWRQICGTVAAPLSKKKKKKTVE